jgi:hypothetical protein
MEVDLVILMKLMLLMLTQLTLEKRTSIFLTHRKKVGDYVTQFLKALKEVFMLEVQ